MSRAYHVKHKPSGMFLFSTYRSICQYTPSLVYTEYEVSIYKSTPLYLLSLAYHIEFIWPYGLRVSDSEVVTPKQKDFIFIPANRDILIK